MSSVAQMRKIKKPLIERRRRERINECLSQLKVLVLEAMNKDESRYSKMEKADILEMAVTYIRSLRQRSSPVSSSTDRQAVDKFMTGFSECALQVEEYLKCTSDLEKSNRDILMKHLMLSLQRYAKTNAADDYDSMQTARLEQANLCLRQEDLKRTEASFQKGVVLSSEQIRLPTGVKSEASPAVSPSKSCDFTPRSPDPSTTQQELLRMNGLPVFALVSAAGMSQLQLQTDLSGVRNVVPLYLEPSKLHGVPVIDANNNVLCNSRSPSSSVFQQDRQAPFFVNSLVGNTSPKMKEFCSGVNYSSAGQPIRTVDPDLLRNRSLSLDFLSSTSKDCSAAVWQPWR